MSLRYASICDGIGAAHAGRMAQQEGEKPETVEKKAWMPGTAIQTAARPQTRRDRVYGHPLVVDNFAGAGGASVGIAAALGREPDIAINHDELALEVYRANHPHTRLYCEDIFHVDPVAVAAGRPVDIAWFSPDCTHFSKAKGGKPRDQRIRGLAWVAIRWAKAVRPRVIFLENVEEFRTWGPLGKRGRPLKRGRGKTFRAWLECLREEGYNVDYRELVAADYGTPTTRKRFFLVARCDGKPIRWPERTHAPRYLADQLGLRPWRTAAECIDWSIPGRSIFRRPRPLAEATMRRIAMGLRRYVLEAKEPYIVPAFLAKHYGGVVGHGLDRPIGTVTSVDHHSLVTAFLSKYYGQSIGTDPAEPCGALMQRNHEAIVTPFLQHVQHASKANGCMPADDPLRTITAQPKGGGMAVVAPWLAKLYGTCRHGQDIREPLPTITGGGQHVAEVRAFLVKYYGQGGQLADCREPMHTLTTKMRMGIVTVRGQDYQIVDIALRMLEPKELLRAQFGRFAARYKLVGTKARQVASIGNSVPPEVAEAIVRVNV